jgi:hypothetical protein
MAPVVALVDDLMFVSRIREAARGCGLEVRTVRRVADLLDACRAAGCTLALPRSAFVEQLPVLLQSAAEPPVEL